MAGVTEAQASIKRRRRSCNVGGGVAYTCPFMCPHKKKSNGVKSGLSKRGFLRGKNFHLSFLCCPEDGQERMLAHLQVDLCVLHYQVYELELDWSRTFQMVCREGCGPSWKRSRYRLAADFA
ncbi:hypothetical protein AVEN_107925-1 [Araneus ventricosus]|uniref:Uncharacterized protein n=1 Tax=Araneus ventricosus TaxID=182803 RepID=A0A4Y2L1L5_ARAVE|nr:hypothetical protein AVEN_107925-1 [Araneus ventricosus]